MNNKSKKALKFILCMAISLGIIMGDCMVALADEDTANDPGVGKYGMTAIHGSYVKDGTYDIKVESNNKYFKVVKGTLKVENGEMTGSIEIGSHSYTKFFLGTGKEAKEANESDYVMPEEAGDSYIFTFPVKALNAPIDVAAYSKRKKKWYDRKLLFDATTLPKGALTIDLPDYDAIEKAMNAANDGTATGNDNPNDPDDKKTGNGSYQNGVYGGAAGDAYTPGEAVEVPYEDGEYSIEVSMAGGTGRVTISSPTLMIVKDGKAYAKILMSSSHYDWMIAAGVKYENENKDGGNSYFIIPITAMDTLVNIVANTTAMGDPVAIQYTLTFYSETIGNKGQIPQEAAKKVIIVAAILIVVLAILNYFVKKNRKKVRKK